MAKKAKQNWDVFQSMFGRRYFSKHYGKVRLREIEEESKQESVGSYSKEGEVTSKLEGMKQCYKCKKFHKGKCVTDEIECYFYCKKRQHKYKCLVFTLDKQVGAWVVSIAPSIRRQVAASTKGKDKLC